MKKVSAILAALVSALLGAQAQTTLIEWQTNWPTGTGGSLATNTTLPGSSPWFSGTQTAVAGTVNGAGTKTNLVATIPSGSLTYWTYFAPSNSPVTLSPGATLRFSMDFNVTGSVVQNNGRGLRIGLLYAGTNGGVGQTYWNGTGYTPTGTPKQTNYWGYVQQLNFGTTFGVEPLQTYAYTNGLPPANTDSVLAKTADGIQVGGNGGGTTNDVGFVDGTNYTFVMTITNINSTNISITTTVSGYGLSNSVDHTAGYISQTVLDTNFCYTNFDGVCFRPAANTSVANTFTITSFKVEKITGSTVLPAPYLTNSVSGGNLNLYWNSAYLGYWLQSRNSLTTGTWSDVAGSSAVTSMAIPINHSVGSVFYRLSSVP
jgi:hypothetical protein